MSRLRQAVVVIHGIGEQKPMSTLRGFVTSVFEAKPGRAAQFYSKPDELSDLYELRRLSVYTQSKYASDFFEYYWAHNFRGTTLSHLAAWAFKLIFRWPSDIPNRIRWVYFASWGMLIFYGVLLCLGIREYRQDNEFFSLPLIALLSTLSVHAFTFLGTHYLGDAARYTYAAPDNIAERQKIRSDGVKLLKKIHESKKYDRIIVIGHSLGSVIAYDMLKHLWSQYNTTHNSPKDIDRSKLNDYEAKFTGDPKTWSKKELQEFHALQGELWKEQKALGNPWRISDFITLGSPLAYSSLLMASNAKELQARIDERELPTCPPETEGKQISYPVDYQYTVAYQHSADPNKDEAMKRTLMCLHHAAHFACTRWHNLYYQRDFVGGPLSEVLGKGIVDIKVNTTSWVWNYIPFAAHTHYWGKVDANNSRVKESLSKIGEVLFH